MKDLEGRSFGRLTASNKTRRIALVTVRRCVCDCGQVVWLPTQRLLSGHTQSCDCLKKDFKKLPYGRAARNEVLDSYKRGAAKRGLPWSISGRQFDALTKSTCFYCRRAPSTTRKSRRDTGSFVYNGIDRYNPKRGYVRGNVVPCCAICNRAKSNLTTSEFYEWIKSLVMEYKNAF